MLFNTLQYALFVPIIFIIYWLIGHYKKMRFQNFIVLIASFFFYGCWDVRFLGLLTFSILVDYFSGIQIEKVKKRSNQKIWLWISIAINLGFLGFFKYYNFFIHSFIDLFSSFGMNVQASTLSIILPVGISFYTFHGLSYVIDIYYRRIKAEKNIIDYALFVSYFPLLVAGPIERATHLLPQLKKEREFRYSQVVEGLKQILWGLVKKVLIADQCAIIANDIFNNAEQYYGLTLVIGAIFFSIQIYGDFSGYSDIALGTSKLLGIELLKNFSFPYFSRSISEFWRRWHISLSTWFKDYVYIPLGGSKAGTVRKIRNTFIIFLISGFWHGANLTFIIWGGLNALFIIPSVIRKTNRKHIEIVASNSIFPNWREVFQMILTFSLVSFAWIFFRATSISEAFLFIKHLIGGLNQVWVYQATLSYLKWNIDFNIFIFIILFFMIEWIGRRYYNPMLIIDKLNTFFRWLFYSIVIVLVLYFSGADKQFIYFQF